AIQVDTWIDELVTTGSVSLANAKIYTLDDILRRKPAVWERMFSQEWVAEAEKLTGWKWNWQCMGQFINDCVYAYLPSEIVETLKELNPRANDGRRVHKHHQFLQPEVRERVACHLQDVFTLMKVSDGDIEFFKVLMIRKYGTFRLSGEDEMPLFKAETVFLLKA
ncbi:MAG: P63C domain-containing protein, partial [Aeromonas sp.]